MKSIWNTIKHDFKAYIIIAIMSVIMVLSLSACNYNPIDTKWNFNKAYINWGDHTELVELESWTEDETTFTIQTKDGRVICSDQQNIYLIKE